MREIKFRGIIKNTQNEWIFGDLLRNFYIEGGDKVTNGIVEDYDVAEVKPETIGQYIKKKDKNGKEIYEGDIVTGAYKDMLGYNAGDIKGVVMFVNGEIIVSDGITDYLIRDITDIQVIGNIFDNPELKKQIWLT